MKIHLLRAFVLVAEAQSLSRAAVATDMAPSMVSRHITELEQRWGGRLFERTGRGMALTGLGERMYPESRRLVEQLDQLDVAARDAAPVLTGTVHVGMLPSMARQLLPRLLADLQVRAPAVRLHVCEGFSGTLDDQLGAGRLDMIVVNRYGASAMRGEDELGKVQTCLIGRRGGVLPDVSAIRFSQLAGVPLVVPSRPNGMRSTMELLERKHRTKLDIFMEVDTANMMVEVAVSGHACTLLPRMAVHTELQAGLLHAVRISRPAITRTIALALGQRRPLSQAARFVASRLGPLAREVLQNA